MFCIKISPTSTGSHLTTNQDIIRGVIDRALTKKVGMVPGLRCVGVMTTGDFFAPDSMISRGGRRERVIQAGSYRIRFGSLPTRSCSTNTVVEVQSIQRRGITSKPIARIYLYLMCTSSGLSFSSPPRLGTRGILCMSAIVAESIP